MSEIGALVLVVEDNDKNLKLARDLLAVAGYRVLAAGTGEEGVRLAREHRPDLVLLDVMMPRMDGYAVCREIRAAGPAARISAKGSGSATTSTMRPSSRRSPSPPLSIAASPRSSRNSSPPTPVIAIRRRWPASKSSTTVSAGAPDHLPAGMTLSARSITAFSAAASLGRPPV